jgi:uncharacterized protein (DUF1330 family)
LDLAPLAANAAIVAGTPPAEKGDSAMPAYLIADIDVHDPHGYEEYRNRVSAVIAYHGGKYVARGGACELLEGSGEPHRIVILEFPTMEKLKTFYYSTDYTALKDLRKRSSSARIFVVEGV